MLHVEQMKELPKPGHHQQEDDDEERNRMRGNQGAADQEPKHQRRPKPRNKRGEPALLGSRLQAGGWSLVGHSGMERWSSGEAISAPQPSTINHQLARSAPSQGWSTDCQRA
jgi:hypothetical protein